MIQQLRVIKEGIPVKEKETAMNAHSLKTFGSRSWPGLLLIILIPLQAFAESTATNRPSTQARCSIVQISGTVLVQRRNALRADPAYVRQELEDGDRVITRENSEAILSLGGVRRLRCSQLTEFWLLPAEGRKANFAIRIIRGLFYYFHRDQPDELEFHTTFSSAAVKGTEFNLEVAEDETMTVTMLDGKVELRNDLGLATIAADGTGAGAQGVAAPGSPPELRPILGTRNIIQWSLYYPGIVHLPDLELDAAEKEALKESLAAYASGDLLRALEQYPKQRQPASIAERTYRGALLLAVGQVENCLKLLDSMAGEGGGGSSKLKALRVADALRQLIAAVKMQPCSGNQRPELATEWLAESYCRQSRSWRREALESAREAARMAVSQASDFGFGWARVAELEFSFGQTPEAQIALEKSLALAAHNAQALALKGFLSAAENKIDTALEWFNQALTVDPGLGNAWLGRGLCKIRRGQRSAGREDLAVAAILEPQRALLRSYLGKAFSDGGDLAQAEYQLERAKQLDVNDPTAWFYSALLDQQSNRLNEAVRDLEEAQKKNDNRKLYRSTLLLDQDRAVQSANLASIYRDLGMTDVSVREAGRALAADYANYSAHLFLASSYDELRDPNRVNLRYETPAESEYLIANLLAPVGAGLLAQSVSQQEYSKLFERDRLGVSSSTEYLSRGAWLERGTQYGIYGNSSYLFDARYRSDPGQQPNGDFEERELQLHLKQQITPQDSIYLRAIHYAANGGDTRQYYDPNQSSVDLRIKETSEPTLHLGYHHEWNPGVHTLLLAGRLSDSFVLGNSSEPTLFIIRPPDQAPTDFERMWANLRYRRTQEIYSGEFQHIFGQEDRHTILGGRFQKGEIHTRSQQTDPSVIGEILGFFEPDRPIASQDFTSELERASLYAYQDWQVWRAVRLIGGLTWDRLIYPASYRAPPISDLKAQTERFSPKAGLIFTPVGSTTFRFGWARSLAGASSDQSYLLEPTQIAGFNQSFRSVIPESIGGSGIGARTEIFAASLEYKPGSTTYLAASGRILNSRERLELGAFSYTGESFFAEPSLALRSLDFDEKTFMISANQLISKEWSFAAQYQMTYAKLAVEYPEITDSAFLIGLQPKEDLKAWLHQISLQATYTDPRGFFSQFQASWFQQNNQGYLPDRPGDDFWQLNFFVGWRSQGRKAEIRAGILNLTDQNYQLNPLTLYNELPRSRTFSARLRFNF